LEIDAAGRLFRTAWVDGVMRHYPGTPKAGYVGPWDDMPEWERDSARTVAGLIAQLVDASDGGTAGLSREQRSQFVATAWIAQIYKHFPDPKPSYVTPWPDLPAWQQETDADIFDVIEQAVRGDTPVVPQLGESGPGPAAIR
jgi:hypothetical protein